jgi:hypothetical protein
VDRLEAECERANAGLLIIDSGPAFLDSGLSGNDEPHIRQLLRPLARMAERLDLIVLVLVHLNKKTGTQASVRVMGGAAWRNAARLVLFLGAPAGIAARDTLERLLMVEKSNLGRTPPAQTLRIKPFEDDPDDVAGIEWGDEAEVDIDVVLGPLDRKAPKLEQAKDFLRGALLLGPRPIQEVIDEGLAEGLTKDAIERARKSLHIKGSKPDGMGGQRTWALPGEEQS